MIKKFRRNISWAHWNNCARAYAIKLAVEDLGLKSEYMVFSDDMDVPSCIHLRAGSVGHLYVDQFEHAYHSASSSNRSRDAPAETEKETKPAYIEKGCD